MKIIKKIAILLFALVVFLTGPAFRIYADNNQEEGVKIISVSAERTTSFYFNINAVYVDDGSRVEDGKQYNIYAVNSAGDKIFLQTKYTDNTMDRFFNLKFDVSNWDLEGYNALEIHQMTDLDRMTRSSNNQTNPGRVRVVYYAQGGKFKNDESDNIVPSRRNGHISIFEGYEEPVRANYRFSHWITSSGQVWDLENSRIPAGINAYELFAIWVDDSKYTVSFNTMGGDTIPSLENVPVNTSISMPRIPIKLDNIFIGWYKDSDYNQEWNFTEDKVMSDITLYAKWKANTYYNVDFNTHGGNPIDTIRVLENNKVTEPSQPIKEGNIFKGWYKDEGLTEVWNFESPITSDMILHAKWEEIPAEVYYTVTFNTNGGSTLEALTVLENSLINEPTNPTKAGYTFKGWYKDENFKETWDFAVMITEDVTLYAKWNKNDTDEELPETGLERSLLFPSGITLLSIGTFLRLKKRNK